ncbi:hypothetical protein P7K49_029993 [Saguinus oedipus]|uniref:Uncharacterized protein n=1 Tax=Saguinus oedipus TaxID=9490 RepID=A0ABQ9U8T1_SAGOE|nr:hypothetical protein P7K49_029993 [Saguinus oedipus]
MLLMKPCSFTNAVPVSHLQPHQRCAQVTCSLTNAVPESPAASPTLCPELGQLDGCSRVAGLENWTQMSTHMIKSPLEETNTTVSGRLLMTQVQRPQGFWRAETWMLLSCHKSPEIPEWARGPRGRKAKLQWLLKTPVRNAPLQKADLETEESEALCRCCLALSGGGEL